MVIKGGMSKADMLNKTMKLDGHSGPGPAVYATPIPMSWTAAAGSESALPGRWHWIRKFIVCDEPVSALDVSIQAQILNLLLDLQEERQSQLIFLSRMIFSVVKYISDNILVMYLGQMVELAPSDESMQASSTSRTTRGAPGRTWAP